MLRPKLHNALIDKEHYKSAPDRDLREQLWEVMQQAESQGPYIQTCLTPSV